MTWHKGITFGKLHLYVAWNCSMKKRARNKSNRGSGITKKGGMMTCAMCGGQFAAKRMTIHHKLPQSVFGYLRDDERNRMAVCRACHHKIHTEPALSLRLMHEAANDMGIDLNKYFTT